MKNLIKNLIILILPKLMFSFTCYGNYHLKTNDSILAFKSESLELIKIDSNKNIESKITKIINYHIINFSTNEIIFFFKRKDKDWESKTFKYYSTEENSETIEFITQSELNHKIYLDINPYKTIVYSYKNGNILAFSELKVLNENQIDMLKMYDLINIPESSEKTNEIIINERISDFEFSEYWRKESFKKAVDYLKEILQNESPRCEMIRRSTYNPSKVVYLGYQGFRVKLYAEYDCNQNYINQSYFWIHVYYLGYDKWNITLNDQRLAD